MAAFHEQRKYSGSFHFTAGKSSEMNFLAHYHDEFELFFVCEGEHRMGIDNQELLLRAGQIGMAAPWHIHYYKSAGPMSGYMVIFAPEILGRRLPTESCLWTVDPQHPVFQEIRQLAAGLSQEMQDRRAYHELAATGLMCQFMARLERGGPGISLKILSSDQRSRGRLMQDILAYLSDNFREPLSRNDIAAYFNISPAHLSRLFKGATGLSLPQYLTRLRVDKAQETIRQSNEPITEIALSSGFESIRTFNRSFHRVIGHSPSSLRQQQP